MVEATNNYDEMQHRVSMLSNAINLNKIKNLASDTVRFLAFLIIISKKKRTVILDYKKDFWIQKNFDEKRFKKCLATFKIFDIIVLLNLKECIFKINSDSLTNVLSNKVGLRDLNEIDDYAIKKFRELEMSKEPDDSSTLSFLQSASKKRKSKKTKRMDSRVSFTEYTFCPSENPKLQSWESRDVKQWRSIDFLGYYFNCYKIETGYENVSFQTEQTYIKIKNAIRLILREWFQDDKETFKKYINWAVNFLHNSNWVNHNCGASSVFPYIVKTYIFDTFMKENSAKEPSKKKRRKIDNEFADNKNWSKNE